MNAKILLADSDSTMRDSALSALQQRGYRVITAGTLAQVQSVLHKRLKTMPVSLLILGMTMPDGSGVEFCQHLRKTSEIPIMFLVEEDEKDRIADALFLGGDDCLVKPYDINEFVARVNALIRRSLLGSIQSGLWVGPHLFLNLSAQRAYYGEVDLLLKPKEFLLLRALARRSAGVYAHQLYEDVWGLRGNNDLRTLYVNISTLRSKLNRNGVVGVSIVHDDDDWFFLDVKNLLPSTHASES
ncbi:MAG: response regulator transcription factor [Coriobacteriales bacterium]|jgi:DNA-binding response OmpR family regulator|nr:response regulator transcription factor [Coriobacteriales bacterium]